MLSCKFFVQKVLNACAGQWLQVLQLLLQILEVPSTIITGMRSPDSASLCRVILTPSPFAAVDAEQAAAPLSCAVVLSHMAGYAAGVTS